MPLGEPEHLEPGDDGVVMLAEHVLQVGQPGGEPLRVGAEDRHDRLDRVADPLGSLPDVVQPQRPIVGRGGPARLGPELKRRGLLFTGIDVIGPYLTEINVTSPTGIRQVMTFGGPDIAALIWDAVEAKAGSPRTSGPAAT